MCQQVQGPISPCPHMSGTGNMPLAEGPRGWEQDGRAEQGRPCGQRSPWATLPGSRWRLQSMG